MKKICVKQVNENKVIIRASGLLVQSPRLENPRSSCTPIHLSPVFPTKVSFSTTSKHCLNIARDGDSAFLSSLFWHLTAPLEKYFLMFNLNLQWCNFRPVPLVLFPVNVGEEANSHLTTTSLQVVVESSKVTPEPPALQLPNLFEGDKYRSTKIREA